LCPLFHAHLFYLQTTAELTETIYSQDEIPQVREIFAAKLHKGLSKGIPNNRCLPLDFMGYYALAGQEQDKRIKAQIRQHMVSDINKRREYIKSLPVWSTGGIV
jgi:sister-chromatid-cohesion protein PDS5